MPPKHSARTPSNNSNSSSSSFNEIKKEINIIFPKDTVVIAYNVVAAALLLIGGMVGFLNKGSKMSLAVSFLFACAWLYSAFSLRKHTGMKLEQTVRKRLAKMSKDKEWFLRNIIDIEATKKRIFKSYLTASISSAALCALMLIRVIVMEIEVTTPILIIVATGSIVFMMNTQKVLMMTL